MLQLSTLRGDTLNPSALNNIALNVVPPLLTPHTHRLVPPMVRSPHRACDLAVYPPRRPAPATHPSHRTLRSSIMHPPAGHRAVKAVRTHRYGIVSTHHTLHQRCISTSSCARLVSGASTAHGRSARVAADVVLTGSAELLGLATQAPDVVPGDSLREEMDQLRRSLAALTTDTIPESARPAVPAVSGSSGAYDWRRELHAGSCARALR
jgi:hypothetical protein